MTKKQAELIKNQQRERKARQRALDKKAGIKDYQVRCHEDDIDEIRDLANAKLNKRLKRLP